MHVGVDADGRKPDDTVEKKREEPCVYSSGRDGMLRRHRIAKDAVFERRRAIGSFLMLARRHRFKFSSRARSRMMSAIFSIESGRTECFLEI
jgi:hypothetical protein